MVASPMVHLATEPAESNRARKDSSRASAPRSENNVHRATVALPEPAMASPELHVMRKGTRRGSRSTHGVVAVAGSRVPAMSTCERPYGSHSCAQ
eukprot:scaffold23608_cov24-Tisochrysis_lutea.AAC.2